MESKGYIESLLFDKVHQACAGLLQESAPIDSNLVLTQMKKTDAQAVRVLMNWAGGEEPLKSRIREQILRINPATDRTYIFHVKQPRPHDLATKIALSRVWAPAYRVLLWAGVAAAIAYVFLLEVIRGSPQALGTVMVVAYVDPGTRWWLYDLYWYSIEGQTIATVLLVAALSVSYLRWIGREWVFLHPEKIALFPDGIAMALFSNRFRLSRLPIFLAYPSMGAFLVLTSILLEFYVGLQAAVDMVQLVLTGWWFYAISFFWVVVLCAIPFWVAFAARRYVARVSELYRRQTKVVAGLVDEFAKRVEPDLE